MPIYNLGSPTRSRGRGPKMYSASSSVNFNSTGFGTIATGLSGIDNAVATVQNGTTGYHLNVDAATTTGGTLGLFLTTAATGTTAADATIVVNVFAQGD